MMTTSIMRLIFGYGGLKVGFAIMATCMIFGISNLDLDYALSELIPLTNTVMSLTMVMLAPMLLTAIPMNWVMILLLNRLTAALHQWGFRSAQILISTMHWFVLAAILSTSLGQPPEILRTAIMLDLFLVLLLTGLVIACDAQFDACKTDRRRSLWRASLFCLTLFLMCYQVSPELFLEVLAFFMLGQAIFLALYLRWHRHAYSSRFAALRALLD